MLGYIKVIPAELKVKEYEFYKSVYCGLCKTMGKKLGSLSRLALSYDFTFLALVRLSVSDDEISFKKTHCVLRRCNSAALNDCPSLEYCARAGAVLAYRKLLDDIEDRKGMRRAFCKAALPAAKRMLKRADMPHLDEKVFCELQKLYELEKKNVFLLDEAAEYFGNAVAVTASYGIEDETVSRVLSEYGRHIGRFIYIADAADDYESDYIHGCRNPLIEKDKPKLSEKELDDLRTSMLMELGEAEKALALIPFRDKGIENIVKNIMYFGLPNVINDICSGKHKDLKGKNK